MQGLSWSQLGNSGMGLWRCSSGMWQWAEAVVVGCTIVFPFLLVQIMWILCFRQELRFADVHLQRGGWWTGSHGPIYARAETPYQMLRCLGFSCNFMICSGYVGGRTEASSHSRIGKPIAFTPDYLFSTEEQIPTCLCHPNSLDQSCHTAGKLVQILGMPPPS